MKFVCSVCGYVHEGDSPKYVLYARLPPINSLHRRMTEYGQPSTLSVLRRAFPRIF